MTILLIAQSDPSKETEIKMDGLFNFKNSMLKTWNFENMEKILELDPHMMLSEIGF